MSTANQEGSGHTFFHEWGAGQEDTFTPFSRPARWIRRVLMHMCIHKLIWATDNEFPSIHFLLTATQFQQGRVGAAGAWPRSHELSRQTAPLLLSFYGNACKAPAEEMRLLSPVHYPNFCHVSCSSAAFTSCHRSHKQCSEAWLNI